jgi:hypothetical protein
MRLGKYFLYFIISVYNNSDAKHPRRMGTFILPYIYKARKLNTERLLKHTSLAT